jgi:hypothetical protein
MLSCRNISCLYKGLESIDDRLLSIVKNEENNIKNIKIKKEMDGRTLKESSKADKERRKNEGRKKGEKRNRKKCKKTKGGNTGVKKEGRKERR